MQSHMATQRYTVTPHPIENCIPSGMVDSTVPDYDAFLEQRRKLMAAKIKAYFKTL